MIGFLLVILPYVAFLGLLVVVAVTALVFFWPQVEWWLLCTLQSRRKAREQRHLGAPKVQRLALRRPR